MRVSGSANLNTSVVTSVVVSVRVNTSGGNVYGHEPDAEIDVQGGRDGHKKVRT